MAGECTICLLLPVLLLLLLSGVVLLALLHRLLLAKCFVNRLLQQNAAAACDSCATRIELRLESERATKCRLIYAAAVLLLLLMRQLIDSQLKTA